MLTRFGTYVGHSAKSIVLETVEIIRCTKRNVYQNYSLFINIIVFLDILDEKATVV